MFALRIILMMLACLCSLLVFAAGQHNKMDEAEAYLAVNPAQSLVLLDEVALVNFSAEDDIRWHLLNMRAAVPTNKLDRLRTSLEQIMAYQAHPALLPHITSVSSAAGIWLRRQNYLHDARASLACAEKYASVSQRVTLLNSIGLVNRQLNDYDNARLMFQRALTLAEQHNNVKVMAMVENNLGLVALDQANLALAETHLRTALSLYQKIDQRSGQVSAGLNLLLTFLLQHELQNFQRLHGPTSRLTQAFSNEAKQALLSWLDARYAQLTGDHNTPISKDTLQAEYLKLEDDKTQRVIQQFLAIPMDISVSPPVTVIRHAFAQPWFYPIKMCQWPLLSPVMVPSTR